MILILSINEKVLMGVQIQSLGSDEKIVLLLFLVSVAFYERLLHGREPYRGRVL